MKKELIEVSNLKDRQVLLVKLLEQFHNICEENGLIYNIFGGTMLGAVRHHGIIPWDDDVDVTMPRNDYNQFIEIVRKKYSKQFVVHAYPDNDYIYPYAKFGIRGTKLYEEIVKEKYSCLSLNIDIFPNDGYPQDEGIFEKYRKCEEAIILLTYKNDLPHNIIFKTYTIIKKLFYSVLGVDYFVRKQIRLFSQYPENGEYIVCQGAGWGEKGKLKRSIYYDRAQYEFSGIVVWGIRDYHQHLTNLYGDYMTPPPKEKQKSSHESLLLVSEEVVNYYLGGKE